MVASTFLIALDNFIDTLPPPIHDTLPRLNFGVAVAAYTAFFAITYKILPDAKVSWRDVLVGALATSLLFTLGQFLIGKYLGRVNLRQFFGAASSLILVLIWVYYSMQIILIGAKFTQVFADRHGSKVLPSGRAELVLRQRVKNGN
jgi:membrane protein